MPTHEPAPHEPAPHEPAPHEPAPHEPAPHEPAPQGTRYHQLRRTFLVVNRFVLGLWRVHLGWCMSCFPPLTGRVMLLTHTGRTSGLARRTPVNYRKIDGDVWVAAMPGAVWLRNIQADPRVRLRLPFSRWRGVAEVVPVDADHLAQFRAVLLSGGWIAATLDGFRPGRASEAELLDHGRGFHLLRIGGLERLRPGRDGDHGSGSTPSSEPLPR